MTVLVNRLIKQLHIYSLKHAITQPHVGPTQMRWSHYFLLQSTLKLY